MTTGRRDDSICDHESTDTSMNVLQVAPKTMYPPTHGGESRAQGLLQGFLAADDGVRRVVQGGLVANHDLPTVERRLQTPNGCEVFRPANPIHDLPSLFPAVFDQPTPLLGPLLKLWPPRPLREGLTWADVVLVEGPLQVPAVCALADETPVVYSSHNVESDRWPFLVDSDALYDRLVAIERRAVAECDTLVCTSHRDVRRFDDLFGVTSSTVIARNGASATAFDPPTERAVKRVRNRILPPDASRLAVFVGSDYEPNIEAVRRLFESDVPEDFHLVVVGSVGDRFSTPPEWVTTTGFVDNLYTHIAAADVALNPITSGGGSNVKVAEYLAQGLPVVSTPFGTRGYDLRDGETVLLADPDETLATASSPTDAELERLGEQSQTYAETHLRWETIGHRLRSDLVETLR